MPTLPERSAVVPGSPASHFRGVESFNAVVPKSAPHIFAHVGQVEGDGGQGTKSNYVLHDLHPHDGGALAINAVMEMYDKTAHTYVVSITGDPRFTDSRFTVKFLPGPTEDTSTLKWSCEYTPVDPNSSGPTNIMDVVPQVYENLSPHVDEYHAKQQAA